MRGWQLPAVAEEWEDQAPCLANAIPCPDLPASPLKGPDPLQPVSTGAPWGEPVNLRRQHVAFCRLSSLLRLMTQQVYLQCMVSIEHGPYMCEVSHLLEFFEQVCGAPSEPRRRKHG